MVLTVSARAQRLVRWVVGAAWTAALAVLFVLPSGPPQGQAYVALLWSVVLAMAVAVRVHRPPREGAWWRLVAGVGLLGVAAVMDVRLFNVEGTPAPSPLTDLIAAVAFPLIGLGAVRFATAQSGGADRGPTIDSALLTLGLSTVLVEVAIARHAVGDREPNELLSVVVISCVACWVMAMTTRTLLAGGWRTSSGWLLMASSIAGVVAAGGLVAAGTASDIPRVTLLAWAVALVLIGAATLSPRMALLTMPTDVAGAHVASRVILPAVAVISPSVAMLVRQVAGGGTPVVTGVASLLIGLIVVGRFVDLVWDRERAQAALRHAATHDELTGLANRVLLMVEVTRRLEAGVPFGLVFLDLDGFKAVNDRLGHRTGDLVLAAVGARLAASVDEGDLAARLAGDEFVLVIATAAEPALQERAGHIAEVLTEPVMFGDIPLAVGASLGVTAARPGDTPERLLTRADQAMYRVKRGGGGVLVA